MTEIDLTPVTRLEYDIDAILNDHAVAEPITRIELILADIVAGNTTTVEPVTRIETYLAIISGADYPVPEPVTRIETFLAIIAGEDYEEPEAVTRLEGLLAEWVEKGSGIWKTVTGSLIHITDALASPMQKCEVTLEPIQDLHGQDAPYPAGGGANKMPAAAANVITNNGITFTSYGDGRYAIKGTASSAATAYFALPAFVIPPSSETTFCIMNSQAFGAISFIYNNAAVDSWSMSSINKTSDGYSTMGNKNCNGIKFDIPSGTVVDMSVSPMLLLKGYDTSVFAPYSNICPITGWTGCEVTRTGKNLSSMSTMPNNPDAFWGGDSSELKAVLNSLPIGTYTISNKFKIVTAPDSNAVQHGRFYITAMVNGSQQAVLGYSVTSDSNAYVGKVYEESGTFTITEDNKGNINHCYVYCDRKDSHSGTGRGTYNCYDIQIEHDSSATDYEALNIATASVTFPDSAGTVYGGTVDLVSGLLTVDTVKAVADGTQSPSDYDEHFIEFISKFPTAAGYNPTAINLKCNRLKPSGYTEGNNNVIFFSNAVVIFFRVSESVSNWTTYLQNNPVEFSYKIAEPITIQLTPQQISTLKGENNVWGSGDIELTYKAQA